MLSAAQVQQFRSGGWLAVPDFFAAREVAALQAEVRRLQAVGRLRNVATTGDGRTHSQTAFNLQLCPSAPHSPLIGSLRSAPTVTGAVRALIGDPVLYVLDQIFLKPARHGSGTKWHQDNAYWKLPESCHVHGTGMWIAVHEATRANGTMHVIPGSHRRLEAHERDAGSDHHIHAPQVDEAAAVPVELPAGGVLFFNFGMLHCTRGNGTDGERAGLALHFANGDAMPAGFRAAEDTRVPLTRRDGTLTGGVPAADQWEREVERTLTGEPVAV
jgi:phytanoyl-CoA hydroxylase